MAITDFSVNKIQFWAELLGFEVELARVELHYTLNTIPTAVLSCAIGRDVETLLIAAIHTFIDDIKVNVPILVFGAASEDNNSGVSGGIFPAGPFIAFQGRVVGIGFQKSRAGTASLKLFCKNFLMDLEYAPAETSATHPKNIGAIGVAAGLVIPAAGAAIKAAAGAAAGGNPSFAMATTARKIFTAKAIGSDLWGEGFFSWLSSVIQAPTLLGEENINVGQGAGDALAALNLFEPSIDQAYTFGVPMPLNDFAVVKFDAAIQAISKDVVDSTFKLFDGLTMWEKLTQELASKYHFVVVPMAARALAVPFIPGLHDTWITIDSSEYDTISLETELPRAIKGVIVGTGAASMNGPFGFQRGQANAIKTIGGVFVNPDIAEGMFIFRNGPIWLTDVVSLQWWGKDAVGAGKKIRGNALNPGKGGGPRDGVEPLAVRQAAKEMWDAYAHSLYLREALKLRVGSVSGKMRFDIAPGSSIELITTEEKFVDEQAGTGEQSLFGTVTRVSIIYDSEAVQGQTNIDFAYLRDNGENETAFATTSHPLYGSVFLGAPLVEEQPL